MDRTEFINHLATIIVEEGWQTKKGRAIQSSVISQRRAINAIAKALKINKLSLDEVKHLVY